MSRTTPLAAILAFTAATSASAALAPQYQNVKDLEVMVAFVKQHARVASSVKSIDLRGFVVHYGEDCRAEFVRQAIERPPGWAGPQAPLVYARSNCAID